MGSRLLGLRRPAIRQRQQSIDSVYSSLGAEELGLPLTHPATLLASYDKDELEAKLRIAHSKDLPYPLNKYADSVRKLLARRTTGHVQNR